MTELKTLMKSKQKESDSKNKRSHFSHENLDPEKICSLSQPKVPTLIRPQLTNPKVFWSKFEDENFSSGSKNFENSYLEEKIITNFFKPIKNEISPEISNINTDKSKGKKKEEFFAAGKVDKSIHESLRIQKTKRRTSLPFFLNEDVNQELVPAVEKVQTYDFSYYSSILKRINQEKTQYYYSSAKKNGTEKIFPMREFASDERIYGDIQNKLVRELGSTKSERISVTEPSSPLPSDCFAQVNRKTGASDSEIDSESTGSDVVIEVKKSNSFVDEKEADGYFKTKSQHKAATLGLSKTSQSSTSSCDSAYKSRSLRVYPKSKRKSEVRISSNSAYNLPKNQSYVSEPKKYWSEIPGKDASTYRKVLDSEALQRERCAFSNRDSARDEDLQKIKENVFKHLIEALMHKNRAEIINEKQKEVISKSLPRDTRRWKNDKYEEECLKVLRSVLEQGPVAKNQLYKSFDRKYDASKKSSSQNESLSFDTMQRRRKTKEMDSESRGVSARRVSIRTATEKQQQQQILETAQKKKSNTGKLRTNLKEECIFTIEDKKLWIEICKAVEKVDVKRRIAKKCT